jgi:hypothetical protein
MSIIWDCRKLDEIIADYLILDNLVIIGCQLANRVFPDGDDSSDKGKGKKQEGVRNWFSVRNQVRLGINIIVQGRQGQLHAL